jgi:hypothetical protein
VVHKIKSKVYVKAFYDREFSPPQWGVIRYYKNPDGTVGVFDWNGAKNKRDAKKQAKETAKRRNEILEVD